MNNMAIRNHLRYSLVVLPIIVLTILLAFWGVWGAYQAGDDGDAYLMVKGIKSEGSGIKSLLCDLFTKCHSIHWLPISNIIVYLTFDNDKNARIAFVSLLSVFLIALLGGCFARELGASFFPALFCSLWIASSQVLVFPIASSWGPMNILGWVFAMTAAWILWRWLKREITNQEFHRVPWGAAVLFLFIITMGILTCESTISSAILAAGVSAILLSCKHSYPYWRKTGILAVLIIVWIIAYFVIRYTIIEAPVPVFRDEHVEGYQRIRFVIPSIAKNVAQTLLGSLNPVNSYAVYLKIVSKEYIHAVILLLPAFLWGFALLFGWFVLFRKATREKRLKVLFMALLVLCSLFPQCLLGKVSEMYGMASLWPLAILSAIILTYLWKKRWLRYFLVPVLCLFIIGNICSAQAKVREILATGQYAHKMRQSMLELSKELPDGAQIAIIHKPRSEEAFGRFGDRGIWAYDGVYYGDNELSISPVQDGQLIANPQQFDLILMESDDQGTFEVISTGTIQNICK